jgi:hypothetical protein
MPNDTRKNFGVRLPTSLIAAIEARATTTGRSKTQVVESALGAYLGLEATTEGQDVEQRLTEIEQRLTEIEQRLTPSTQKRSTAVEQRITRNAQQHLTPPDAPEPTAASSALLPAAKEELTATEGWVFCQQQGYRGSKAAFRSWAKRNPAELRQQFGLEATGYSGKSNTAPSYRKVQ